MGVGEGRGDLSGDGFWGVGEEDAGEGGGLGFGHFLRGGLEGHDAFCGGWGVLVHEGGGWHGRGEERRSNMEGRLTENSLGCNEMGSICVVEVRDAFASEFKMLGLVFAHWDVGCSFLYGQLLFLFSNDLNRKKRGGSAAHTYGPRYQLLAEQDKRTAPV